MIGNKWKPILTFVQYIYICVRVYIYVCVCLYTYMCIHTYIYILVSMYYHVEIDLFMVIYNTDIYIYHCTTMKGHWFIL
jgi:hypothetical protein